MENSEFYCIWREQVDNTEALNAILRLGDSIIEQLDFEMQLCEPLNFRAYQASVNAYLRLLSPLMSVNKINEYKKEILNERWSAKHYRTDEYISYGIGTHEQFRIGLSTQTINELFYEGYWSELDQNGEYLSSLDGAFIVNDDTPALVVEKSSRVEFIENTLKKKEMGISEIGIEEYDLADLFKNEKIVDIVSLIEYTRKLRNCGICEAIVESGLRLLEAWAKS